MPYLVAREPSGASLSVVALTDGTEASTVRAGVYGEDEGSPSWWELDKLHGGVRSLDDQLVHRGARHHLASDGRWLQPEPLLYLGLTNGDLAEPLGYGPVYARGNSNEWSDRSGYEPNQLEAASADKVGALLAAQNIQSAGQWAATWRGSVPIKTEASRYVYTSKAGWLDMKHVSTAAAVADVGRPAGRVGMTMTAGAAMSLGHVVEVIQTATLQSSGYSYEDVPSNWVGAHLGITVDPGTSFAQNVQAFLEGLGALPPEQAPNWSTMPPDRQQTGGGGWTVVHSEPTHGSGLSATLVNDLAPVDEPER